MLAPSESATFTVRFAPSGEGPLQAAFHIASNDADEPSFDLTVAGAGRIPVPGVVSLNLPPGTTLYVNESAGVINLPIVRTAGTDLDISFAASAEGGTATPGLDFVMPAGPFTLADGVSTLTIPIAILNPADSDEANETFVVQLSDPTDGAAVVVAGAVV